MGRTIKKLPLGWIGMKNHFSFKFGLFALVFGLFCGQLKADDYATQIVGPFGGLNNYDSPMALDSSKSQDLLNVDIVPGGKSVKKRPGYAVQWTLSYPTSPVHGIYRFYDGSGNENILIASDYSLKGSVNGATPVVLRSSNTYGPSYQCVDYAGYAYCANTSRDIIYKTDGQTGSTLLTLVSTGMMLAVTPDRLVMSGFLDAPNRIDFSASGNFLSWVGPFIYATDPNQYTITSPGSRITHICYAFNRIMWFKDSSFGYILTDPTSLNWTVRTISQDIGTLDNTSIYRDGILYFRGQDGHFYAFDGNVPTRMSREITPLIKSSQFRTSNTWLQTTQTDFLNGYSVNIDTYSYPNSLTISTNNTNPLNNSFETFDSGSCGFGSYVARNWNISGGNLGTIAYQPYNGSCVTYINADQSLTVLVLDFDGSVVSSTTFVVTSGSYAKKTIDISATKGKYIRIKYYNMTSNASSQYAISDLFLSGGGDLTFYTKWSGVNAIFVDYFEGGRNLISSGTYYSEVINRPNITSWNNFSATVYGSSHTFSIRASTTVFTKTSVSPSWTTISIGQVPSIATGVYMQIKDEMSASNSTAPFLNDFNINWFEGLATDKAYGQYFENALWWNVQSSSGGQAYNNFVYKYDLLNNGWLVYNIPMNGMYVKNNALYFGSSAGGYVYKYGDVDNDAGSAINAYWKSKDYFGDSPFLDKSFTELSFSAKSQQNSSILLTLNANGVAVSSDTWPLYKVNAATIKYNNCQPLKAIGDIFNVIFGNNAADQPFEVFAGAVGYRSKPMKDTKQ